MRKLAYIIPALLLSIAASAQEFNPTVEVTNKYSSEKGDLPKPLSEFRVPDSLTVFKIDYNYKVEATPYKGAYEFEPYNVRLTPSNDLSKNTPLYARIGAGLLAKSYVELSYRPEFSDLASFGISLNHRGSYLGQHVFALDGDKFASNRERNSCVISRLGVAVDGSYLLGNVKLGAEASYRNVIGGNRGLNVFSGTLAVSPRRVGTFLYNAALTYRHGVDNERNISCTAEDRVDLDFSISPVYYPDQHFVMDGKIAFMSFANAYSLNRTEFIINPKWEEQLDRFNYRLGFKARFAASNGLDYAVFNGNSFGFVLDCMASYSLVEGMLDAYVVAGGDFELNDALSTADRYIHTSRNSFAEYNPAIAATTDVYKLALGVNSKFFNFLQLGLEGGCKFLVNPLVDGVTLTSSGDCLPSFAVLPGMSLAYASLKASWRDEHISASGALNYNYNILRDGNIYAVDVPLGFLPAALTGGVDFGYYFTRRLVVGLGLAGQTGRSIDPRTGYNYSVDGFVDLSAYAEYSLNQSTGLWLRGGNLLCQKVQPIALFADYGPTIMAGVFLKF